MKLTVAFTSGGNPATGLTPVVSGYTHDGTLVVSGESMTEIAAGFYTYDFTDYDHLEDYVFTAFESSLGVGEQYVFASNDSDSQNNQGIIRQILGLVQGNMRAKDQTYDGSGNLLTASIVTYANANDCNLDQNPIHTYEVEATYTSGQLTGYQSREV